jgi:hypothetical protein
VEVTDDVFLAPHNPYRIVEGDSVQFAIGTDVRGKWYYEYCAALIGNRPVLVKLSSPPGENTGVIENADLEIQRSKGRTVYRLSIDWRDLTSIRPDIGRELGFSMAVNDRDHRLQPRAWMEWTPGMIVEKNPSLFGKLRFKRS